MNVNPPVDVPGKMKDVRSKKGKGKKRQNLKKNALWEQAYTKEISLGTAVIVPLSFPEEMFAHISDSTNISLSNLSHIMIYKDGNGKKHTEVVTTIPDEDWLLNPTSKIFSGKILVEDWKGVFIKGYVHKEGAITEISALEEQEESSNARTAPVPCYYYVDYWYCVSTPHSMNCSYNYTERYACSSGGGGYIGGGSSGGDYSSPVYYGGTSGGTGSGSNSGGDTPTEGKEPISVQEYLAKKWEEEKIDDLALTGIAKCIWDKMLRLNSVHPYLEKFDGQFPVAHLKLELDNTLRAGNYGVTHPPVGYWISISLSNDNLGRLSDLGKATSIVHEIVHAEIFRKMLSAAKKGDLDPKNITTEEQINYVNSLKDNAFGIYDYYIQRYHPNWQHNMMASHYISIIADMIEAFDGGTQVRQVYEDVAWAGLKSFGDGTATPAWESLLPEEKSRIQSRINSFFHNGTSKCN